MAWQRSSGVPLPARTTYGLASDTSVGRLTPLSDFAHDSRHFPNAPEMALPGSGVAHLVSHPARKLATQAHDSTNRHVFVNGPPRCFAAATLSGILGASSRCC